MNRIILCLTVLGGFCASLWAETVQKIEPQEYAEKVQSLNSACEAKRMFAFSGFCLSKEYGKPAYADPTQASIHLGLEIASLDHFLQACDHSAGTSVTDSITRAKKVLDTGKFFDEMSIQSEALHNYVGRFYSCKSKAENDALIANRVTWLDYMTQKYSGSQKVEQAIKTTSSSKSARSIVECILSHYTGTGSDFFADGVADQDGSIVISLFTPVTLPLAKVKEVGNGSVTQYVNTDVGKFKSIPQAVDFTNAVTGCQ